MRVETEVFVERAKMRKRKALLGWQMLLPHNEYTALGDGQAVTP